MSTSFPLADIRANPFRAIERYPLRPKKVAALRESIRATSFWENIVARLGQDGKPEIAYGHHRLEALREEFGPDYEVALIIRELDDDHMLRIMIRENDDVWANTATVDQESARAVVCAFGEGRISLPPPPPRSPKRYIRYAPSFRKGHVPGQDREHPYTAAVLAEYLGWDRTKAEDTLAALELQEKGYLDQEEYAGLGAKQARILTVEVRRVMGGYEHWASMYEKHAEEADRASKRLKSGAAGSKAERLRDEALRQAAEARKRARTVAGYLASKVHWELNTAHHDISKSVAKSFSLSFLPARLDEPPPRARLPDDGARQLVRPLGKQEPKEIRHYLDDLMRFYVVVDVVRNHAHRFFPETAELVLRQHEELRRVLEEIDDAVRPSVVFLPGTSLLEWSKG